MAAAVDRRTGIIEAAHRLFVENGFNGTSMRQIAAQSGSSLGGIYNHFDGKEELFEAVFFDFHPYREVLPALQAADGETAENFIRSAAQTLLDALENRPGFLNLMFIEILEFEGQHLPQLYQEILPELMSIATRFEALKERLGTHDLLVVLRAFIGLFFSYYMTELALYGGKNPENAPAFDQFVDIFLHGVLAG
jgi:AcrR family transcriptional regulator